MRIFELLRSAAGGEGLGSLLSFFTPQKASGRGLGVRLLLAGGSMAVMAAALAAAVQAAALLLMALGALYYLMTQVLGVKLDMDPRTLSILEQARRAAGPTPPN